MINVHDNRIFIYANMNNTKLTCHFFDDAHDPVYYYIKSFL